MRSRHILLVGGILLVWAAPPAAARLVYTWSYAELFAKADVVVLATATATEPAADRFTDRRWPFELAGQNTVFEVQHMLKGKVKGKTLKVLHFKFGEVAKELRGVDPGKLVIMDGPTFLRFRTKSVPLKVGGQEFDMPRPAYLLFLKRRADGRYELVSGRIDPDQSVREVFAPLPSYLGGSYSDE